MSILWRNQNRWLLLQKDIKLLPSVIWMKLFWQLDRELVVCVRRCYGILSFLTFRQQSSSEERDLWNIDKWWVWYSRTCWELWRWRRKRGAVNESFGTHLRSALMTILNNQSHAQWYSKQCGRWSQMRFRISFLSKCAKWEYESEERRLCPWRW